MADNSTQKPKRRHRDVDRYFEGYEKRTRLDPATGRRKTEYVYTGDYFTYDLTQQAYNRFRLRSALRIPVAVALFVAANLLGPQGSVTLYVGLPALAAIIPLVYLLIGLAGLLGAKTPKMTLREHTYGLARVQHSAAGAGVFWGISLGGELVYLVLHRAFDPRELISAGLQLVGMALLLWQLRDLAQVESACTHAVRSQYEGMDETEESEGDDTNGSSR